MDSDDSSQTFLNTLSNFNNSDIETPDEFLDCNPSPTNFSQAQFQTINPSVRDESYLSSSSQSYATPIISHLLNNKTDVTCSIQTNLRMPSITLYLTNNNFTTQTTHSKFASWNFRILYHLSSHCTYTSSKNFHEAQTP